MHDYDRRPTTAASSGEKISNIHWMYVDHEKIVEAALRDHNARSAKIETATLIRENVVRTTGTTTDGRTFRIEATFFVKDMIVQSDARTLVEGTVAMGPLPDVLPRVERAIEKVYEALTALGLDRRDYLNLARGWDNVSRDIETWRRGEPVDTKALRSSLNYRVKDIKMLMDALRKKYPGDRQLMDLLDEARKATGAAARGIPDIG